MWPTSRGNRTLSGAEATLIAAGIAVMLDSLDERLEDDDDDECGDSMADMQLGIAVFDALTVPQRIAMLHHVAMHLLTDRDTAFDQTSAVDDATIAAIYAEIQDQVMVEAGLDPDEPEELQSSNSVTNEVIIRETHWRSMVMTAYQQLNSADEDQESAEDWEDIVDALASAILWDRDFELAAGFMDENPESARQRRKLLGIDDDYFVQPPPDPTASQARSLLCQAKAIVSRRPR